jgi:hypothetical protein
LLPNRAVDDDGGARGYTDLPEVAQVR